MRFRKVASLRRSAVLGVGPMTDSKPLFGSVSRGVLPRCSLYGLLSGIPANRSFVGVR
jgi:hypothetical protein